MIIKSLGTGNILEKNKSRIKHVTEVSKDKESLSFLIDMLLDELRNGNVPGVTNTLELLFYEDIHRLEIDELMTRFNNLDNVSKFRDNMINRYIKRPETGFFLNCYTLTIN